MPLKFILVLCIFCRFALTSCPDYSGYFLIEDFEPGANYSEMMVKQKSCSSIWIRYYGEFPSDSIYTVSDAPDCSEGKQKSKIASFKEGLKLTTIDCKTMEVFSTQSWTMHFASSILVVRFLNGQVLAGRRLGK